MPLSARLLIVAVLTAVGIAGVIMAGWWHRTDDLARLDARAQVLGWSIPGPDAREPDGPDTVVSPDRWRALAAPAADWTQPLEWTIDDGAAVLLDGSEGPLAAQAVLVAVEQTLLAVIIGRTEFSAGLARALRLIERCPGQAPGLDPVVQILAPRLDRLPADQRPAVAASLERLAAREASDLAEAMRATWIAVRSLPWIASPAMISAEGWGLRLGREAYLDRFLAWGEQPPAITADLIADLRQRSVQPAGLFAAPAAWARAGTAIQLHLIMAAVARTTLARALAAALVGGPIPEDRSDPTGGPLRSVSVGDDHVRWYLVGLNGSDDRGGDDDPGFILPRGALAP